VFISLSLSCSIEENLKPKRQVQFRVNPPTNTSTRANNIVNEIDALYVSIENDQGAPVFTMHKLNLLQFQDYYVSEPLELEEGNFKLTFYAAVDEDDNILFATPMEGTPAAALVEDPLPIFFTVSGNQTNLVAPQIASTNNTTPEQFGYVAFQLNIVEPPTPPSYSLTINFPLGNMPNAFPHREILITNGDTTIMDTLAINGGNASITFNNLSTGNYTYSIKVNEPGLSDENFCSVGMPFITNRLVGNITVNQNTALTLASPTETPWKKYHATRSTNGTYLFIPFQFNNVINENLLLVELGYNPNQPMKRENLNLYGLPNGHKRQYVLQLYGQTLGQNGYEDVLSKRTNFKFCGSLLSNNECSGYGATDYNLSGSARFLTFNLSDQEKQLINSSNVSLLKFQFSESVDTYFPNVSQLEASSHLYVDIVKFESSEVAGPCVTVNHFKLNQ